MTSHYNTNNLEFISNLTKALDIKDFDISELLIIIPCYNEAKNIEATIKYLLKYNNHFNFIIVDDCSQDNLEEICKKNKWNYIRNQKNLGLSKTIRVGINYALEHNYKYVIQYDGDGQHNAEDIVKLLFFAQKGYDIVTTSRYNYYNETLTKEKKIAHKILSTLFFIKTRIKITDPTCGFRLYNWNAMEVYVNNEKLEVEISSIAYMIKHFKMKLIEVPTYVFERKNGESYLLNKRSKIIKYMLNQIMRLIIMIK